MMGARTKGVRLTLNLPWQVGMLAQVTRAIADVGGDIVAMGTFQGEDPAHAIIVAKVQYVSQEDLLGALKGVEVQIKNVQEA